MNYNTRQFLIKLKTPKNIRYQARQSKTAGESAGQDKKRQNKSRIEQHFKLILIQLCRKSKA